MLHVCITLVCACVHEHSLTEQAMQVLALVGCPRGFGSCSVTVTSRKAPDSLGLVQYCTTNSIDWFCGASSAGKMGVTCRNSGGGQAMAGRRYFNRGSCTPHCIRLHVRKQDSMLLCTLLLHKKRRLLRPCLLKSSNVTQVTRPYQRLLICNSWDAAM